MARYNLPFCQSLMCATYEAEHVLLCANKGSCSRPKKFNLVKWLRFMHLSTILETWRPTSV